MDPTQWPRLGPETEFGGSGRKPFLAVEEYTVAGLDALARHHWSWISESFIHVLMLQEWGESTLSARITDQYSSEIPRAFRLIELMLESKIRISLRDEEAQGRPQWPEPARSVSGVYERELASVKSFESRLQGMSDRFTEEGFNQAARLASEAVASRKTYSDWLVDQETTITEASERICRIPEGEDATWKMFGRGLAHLLSAIDETTIHMLVLRYENQIHEAEESWQASYHYMLIANDIIRFLSRREWAVSFAREGLIEDVVPPCIGATVSEACEKNRERRLYLNDFAKEIDFGLSSMKGVSEIDAEAEAMLQEVARRISSSSSSLSGPLRFESMMGRFPYPS